MTADKIKTYAETSTEFNRWIVSAKTGDVCQYYRAAKVHDTLARARSADFVLDALACAVWAAYLAGRVTLYQDHWNKTYKAVRLAPGSEPVRWHGGIDK